MERQTLFYVVGFLIICVLNWKSILCKLSAFLYDFTAAMQRRDFCFAFWLLMGEMLSLGFQVGLLYLGLRLISWIIGL